jgi:hypothetical protein
VWVIALLHPIRNTALGFPPKAYRRIVIAEIFVMKRVIFHTIKLIPLSISTLDSFHLIKVIYTDFYRIFSGPYNMFIKDRFPLNPGSVKYRFYCINKGGYFRD